MTRRDRTLLFGLAGLTLALACLTLVGLPSDVLLAAPLLCAAIPLLAGRYLGEEQLARLAAAAYAVARGAPAADDPAWPGHLPRAPACCRAAGA